MPRPTPSISNKTIDGGMRPASPRWSNYHGISGSQTPTSTASRGGLVAATSRRGATPVSSPRALPPPPSRMKAVSGREQPSPHGVAVDLRYPSPTMSGGKVRKGMEVEGGGGQEGNRGDSGRIRVAVRVSKLHSMRYASYNLWITAIPSTVELLKTCTTAVRVSILNLKVLFMLCLN